MEIIQANKLTSVRKKEEEQDRFNILWGFVGTNRTGKSVKAREYCEVLRENRPSDYIFSGFDPQRRFKDIISPGFEIYPEDDQWAINALKLRNACLILDDYKIINEKNTAIKGLNTLMYYRAEYNIDIIYICHNPSLILNIFTYFTTHYFLFYSEATDGSFQKKIKNYKLCIKGQEIINNYVRINGRGKYPGPFPYVIVDCEQRELSCMNFKQKPLKQLK